MRQGSKSSSSGALNDSHSGACPGGVVLQLFLSQITCTMEYKSVQCKTETYAMTLALSAIGAGRENPVFHGLDDLKPPVKWAVA